MNKDHTQVLLVEDSPTDFIFLREALETDSLTSFDVTNVERLSQALALLPAGQFDIILLDLCLPDSQGLETFTRLHRSQPEMPIVILSGLADEVFALQAVQAGAQDYLVKSPAGYSSAARSIRYAIERQRSQKALRSSEENYRQLAEKLEQLVVERTAEVRDLYEKAPAGYHSLDENGAFVMVNETELNWLGYTRPELVGVKSIFDLLTPSYQQGFAAAFSQLKTCGSITDVELELIRKDGSLLPVIMNLTAQCDAEGRFLNSRATLFDITERRQAEIAIRENKERLNFLLDKTPAIIFTAGLTADMPITFISDSVRNILGYEPRQYLEDDSFWTSHVYPEDVQQGLTAFQSLMTSGHAIWESRVRRTDGEYHWISTGASLLCDTAGQPLEIIGYSVDINEEKKVQEALNISEAQLRLSRDQLSAANAALEKAARMKDEFLASMSHELRTPLTGILGLSEALQMETYGSLSGKQLDALRHIELSGRHLLALINDILDLSKIEAGKLELQFETTSLNDVCQASLQLTKGMAHKKNQKMGYVMNSNSSVVRADPRRLKQMLVNLLSNAIKFTPEGGSLGLIVESSEPDQVIRLTVWDHGIGIKPEDLLRLFRPFVQLDSRLARQSEGTGLGLSLVQRMTELHGGRLQVESTPGEGSRFTIVLPWSPGGIQPPQQMEQSLRVADNLSDAEKTASGLVSAPSQNAPLVLIVDDNEVTLHVIVDVLESKKLQVITVRNGIEAVRLASENHPDIILMDIQMPGMDGLEATRRLRTHPDARLAATPIIVLTALAMTGDRERCLAAGANDYMSKPIQLQKLVTRIFELLTAV